MPQVIKEKEREKEKDKMSEIDDHISKVYDIHKRLGKGAYGIVWKAIDRKTKDIIAVKKIFDAFRNQTDAQRTFREIIFLKTFKGHPNIVRLHSVHRASNDRDIYLGFEYMETDLHNIIKKGNILKEVHRRYIMYQLFKALKFIHSGNVIHRDLKPSNVLLDSTCRCKIADFGLARTITQNSDGGIGGAGDPTLTDYVATRWYRAPEILIANRKYTKGIDMWSLGCILAEMIAGKPIFPGSSTVNQVEKIMATIPNPSNQDIHTVCISGVGSSMIKNAASAPNVSFESLLGPNLDSDALRLISQLLIFNPHKRLTVKEAIKHDYVARFHDPPEEVSMKSTVVIPFNDDVRLSVDEYRNKLYELMSSPRSPANRQIKVSYLKNKVHCPEINSKVTKSTEKYLKSRVQAGRKNYCSQSEPKMIGVSTKSTHNIGDIKSDSKVLTKYNIQKCNIQFPRDYRERQTRQASGDYSSSIKLRSRTEVLTNKDKNTIKKYGDANRNLYTAFNSYNRSHGIITQSALMELRAAGLH